MSNLEKYNQAFVQAFGVSEDAVEALAYQSITEWDSVGHMGLIAELEDVFDIMMETEDIIEFSSYVEGKNILKKYDVTI
ncbi:acyl carrier protein [Pseudoalteromonas xiamenensis]